MDYEFLMCIFGILAAGVFLIFGHTKAGVICIFLMVGIAIWYCRDEGVGFWIGVLLLLPVFGYLNWMAVKATVRRTQIDRE